MGEERVILITTLSPGENERDLYYKTIEMRSLLESLSLSIVYEMSFSLKGAFFGKGQIEEIKNIVVALEAEGVVIDTFLSPRDEMRLEAIIGKSVSDREEVILSLFRRNASSREAKLQTMKAEAMYLKPRLVYREANYSQQRGGVRGSRGEGEKIIELKRRTIDKRIAALEKETKEIIKTRSTQNKKRKRDGIFSFAILGYTNSGKTTLLKTLCPSSPSGENKLFASLDTTTRLYTLPSGKKIILSDTVGFIRNLPPSLIKAFSSTLEEAISADRIIILSDASHPDCITSFKTTMNTIDALGGKDKIALVILNKIDKAENDYARSYIKSYGYKTIETSLKDKIGVEEIISSLENIVGENYTPITLLLPYSSPLFSHLSSERKIKKAEYREDGILVEAEILKEEKSKYLSYEQK